MAQAARLNLRMQKELKLLMTDPPPGVSLPSLPDETSPFSSLTCIDAQIKGPEGTVYSEGIFAIKIQVPERYPFQPPNVTFATPIYHPNIDNGGRICLDILNLPPKGAWQPSLNISTVLTSIGLLLSEPNPDDGLMAETSKEYKYNRQAFDQKARCWTQKYATCGRSESGDTISKSSEVLEMEVKRTEALPDNATIEIEGSRKKMRLIGEKLSLKPKATIEMNTKMNTNGNKDNVAPPRKLSISRSKIPAELVSSNTGSELLEYGISSCEPKSVCEDDKRASNSDSKNVKGSLKEIEPLIVSDSEESDEGERPLRSRLSLSRNRLWENGRT